MPSKKNTDLKLFNTYTIQICRLDLDWEKNHISFPAFITSFSDNYKVNWKNDEVTFRDTPLQKHTSTVRNLSIAFVVPSGSLKQAKINLEKISKLIRFQYRGRTDKQSPIGSPPFMLLKFLNFASAYNKPLSCTFSEVAFTPTIDAGFFVENKILFPKEYKVTLNCLVDVGREGWQKGQWITRTEKYGFPYDVSPELPNAEASEALKAPDNPVVGAVDALTQALYNKITGQ
jgi:hypothetical protein